MAFMRSDFGDCAGKIFVGGLPKETTLDTFVNYFGKYGDITDSVIMKDRQTGRPRGFGFITYSDPSVVDTIIAETHIIDSKQVEIKRTFPKGSGELKAVKTKKVFVGGIPITTSEDEFKGFFSKYGKVVEHSIILDRETKRSRGFGFIVFDQEQVVDSLLALGNKIDMNGTQVEIKKAEPKKPSNPTSALAYPSECRGNNYNDRSFVNADIGPTSYNKSLTALAYPSEYRGNNYNDRNFANSCFDTTSYNMSLRPGGVLAYPGYNLNPQFVPRRGGFDRYSAVRGAYSHGDTLANYYGPNSGDYNGASPSANGGVGNQRGGKPVYSNRIRYHPYC